MTVRRIARKLKAHGLLGVAKEISTVHRVSLTDLLGASRLRSVQRARRELWSRTHALVLSYERLAEIFGRHRSTLSKTICRYRTGTGLRTEQDRPTDERDYLLEARVPTLGGIFTEMGA